MPGILDLSLARGFSHGLGQKATSSNLSLDPIQGLTAGISRRIFAGRYPRLPNEEDASDAADKDKHVTGS
jgi:hypothetical protein